MLFYLGSDPEVMLQDAKTKQLRSAIPVIPEGKGAGRPIGTRGVNFALHDNVLAEFNTEPAATEAAFVRTIKSALRGVSSLVAEEGCEMVLRASANYPASELNSEEARVFGCEPDYDAYGPSLNVTPSEAAYQPFRSAGGHLHIGMGDDENLNSLLKDEYGGKLVIVKALDVFCAIPSIFLEKDTTAAARRSLYGKAGCHRPKPYGVEYRSLSSWWLGSPAHTKVVWKLTNDALQVVVAGKLDDIVTAIGGEDEVVRIINASDVTKAREVFIAHIRPHLDKATKTLVDKLDEQAVDELFKAWKL